jgi:hypothetical protein
VERILEQHPEARVRVLAIWEPMLPMDWGPPTRWALARLSDPRVQQFWDKDHVMAKRMTDDARAPQPVPDCCTRSGVLWDLAAVYSGGARWDGRLPSAVVFNGPVIDVVSTIESHLRAESAR